MKREIRRYRDADELSRSSASWIARLSRERVRETGLFSIVLSGGNTPRTLYEYMAAHPFVELMPWRETHVFWGDERCVPFNHPDSNYLMARESLLSNVAVPPGNIHPIPVDKGTPEEAAALYERTLRDFIAGRVKKGGPPAGAGERSFDLIILGVGEDGHTASLFPGDPVLEEKERWVAAVTAPDGYAPAHRVTMTLPVINRAGAIIFLAAGPEKKEMIKMLARDAGGRTIYPAAMVRLDGPVVWFVSD